MLDQILNEPVKYLMNPTYVGKDGKDYVTTADLVRANREWSELRFQKKQPTVQLYALR